MEIIALLICANVKGADDHFFSSHAFKDLFICGKLFFFGGKIAIFKIEEFAAEKSYASCVVRKDFSYVPDASDVSVNVDLMSVDGYVFLAFELL